MRIQVTKTITKNGRVYKAGEILDPATSREQSLMRLFGWKALPPEPTPLSGLNKPALIDLAVEAGIDPSGMTKAELREALQA